MPTSSQPSPIPISTDELAACTIGGTPEWGPATARDLISTLLGQAGPFPCTFAVAAAKKQTLRFGFVESPHDARTWTPLADILRVYLDTYKELGKDTSLVVFFRPDEVPLTLEEYFARFWSILQFLHEEDRAPWPAGVPTDPGELWWEFGFGGTEIFVVCNTPAHVTRTSRQSPGFMITFQPRWVFEGLEADTPRGTRARQVIRNRIRRYDGLEPATELGNHGEEGNREWRQYFLPDTPGSGTPSCPFHARSDGGPSSAHPAPREGVHPVTPADASRTDATADLCAAVVNDEDQYSLWPLWRPLPGGWRDTGFHGTREECLSHIESVWTDMRPRSLRESTESLTT